MIFSADENREGCFAFLGKELHGKRLASHEGESRESHGREGVILHVAADRRRFGEDVVVALSNLSLMELPLNFKDAAFMLNEKRDLFPGSAL